MDWWGREELERDIDDDYDHWHMCMRDFVRRSERYGWRDRPSFLYRMEKMEHAYRRGKLAKDEYKKYMEELRDLTSRRGGRLSGNELAILEEFVQYRRRRKKDDFDDRPNPAQSEDKFYVLEKARIKWHQELEESEWHTVYVIKNMVANNIILGNDYHIYRIIDMTKNLQEPVFLTKMAYMAVRMNTASCLLYLLKFGEIQHADREYNFYYRNWQLIHAWCIVNLNLRPHPPAPPPLPHLPAFACIDACTIKN